MQNLVNHTMQRNSRKRQKGLTLPELLFYVVLSGVVLAAIGPKLGSLVPGFTKNDDLQNFEALMSQYGGLLDSQATMAQCAVPDAIANRDYPDKYYVDAQDLHNGYGGAVTMAPVTIATPNDSCAFTTNQLPRDACQQFGNSLALRKMLISINGTALKKNTTDVVANTAINAACSDTPTNTVTVTRPRGAG